MSVLGEVKICNRALTLIGAARINRLDEDSKEARLCNQFYSMVRDEITQAHNWNCATARWRSTAQSDDPLFGWSYQHQLPADFLQVLDAWGTASTSGEGIDHRVEGKLLLCEYQSIYLLYLRQLKDPTLMPPLFGKALASALAVEMTYSIKPSVTTREQLEKMAEKNLAEAKSRDAQEGTPEELSGDDWVASRLG